MKSIPRTRSGIVFASTTALLMAGAPRSSHARNLRSRSSAIPDGVVQNVAAMEEGFEVVSSNDMPRMLQEENGFEAVGGPVNHDPLDDGNNRLHRSVLQDEEEIAEPKEYINDESLIFLEPDEAKHERFERSCNSNQKLWTFRFRTDRYGYETSWKLEKETDDGWQKIASGPPPQRKYHDETVYMGATCLQGDAMYKLTVLDDYQDGFCCSFGEGYYSYAVGEFTEFDTNRQRTFTDKGEHSFYVGLPLPDDNDKNSNNGNNDGPFSGRSGSCGNNQQEIKVKITTDKYGAENSWELRNVATDQIIVEKGLNTYGDGSTDEVTVCVPHGEYKFTITDGIGDGICCKNGEGRYELYMDGELMVYGSDFTFGKRKEHHIVVGYDEIYSQMSQREVQYLSAHNWRRRKYHNRFGESYVPLKYDMSLAQDAQSWANALIADCHVNGIDHEPGAEQGENLAKNSGNGKWGQLYPVENISRRWFEREETWDWPENAHLTQGLWRSARYVGCAESEKTMDNGGTCRIQVCRYARAGNCNMSKYNAKEGDNWKEPMLMDHNPCGPACPPNGCH